MNVLQLVSGLLLMTVMEMSDRFQYYKNYRLEKLCPPDGRKVRMRMEDTVSSFQLNSSLVPGNLFNCHLELVLDSSDSGNSKLFSRKDQFQKMVSKDYFPGKLHCRRDFANSALSPQSSPSMYPY